MIRSFFMNVSRYIVHSIKKFYYTCLVFFVNSHHILLRVLETWSIHLIEMNILMKLTCLTDYGVLVFKLLLLAYIRLIFWAL